MRYLSTPSLLIGLGKKVARVLHLHLPYVESQQRTIVLLNLPPSMLSGKQMLGGTWIEGAPDGIAETQAEC